MTWTPETNRIPWGLLTDDEKAALRACEHGLVIWAGDHWVDKTDGGLWLTSTYRAKPAPKRVVTWHNVYPDWVAPSNQSRAGADLDATHLRICVYRISRNEDGSDPTIDVEGV